MKQKELIALANKAIAQQKSSIFGCGRCPVVQVKINLLAQEVEIHPGVVAKYIGTSPKNERVYNIPAHAILEYYDVQN